MRYDHEKLNELAEKIDIVELIDKQKNYIVKVKTISAVVHFIKTMTLRHSAYIPKQTNGIASDAVPGVLFMIGFARSIILALSRALIESKI